MNRAQTLHQETLSEASIFKRSEKRIMELLIQNHETRAFVTLGFANLHVYCTKGLGLSDAIAYTYSTIAAHHNAIPEIKALIDSDKMSIANATQVIRNITQENKEELLELGQSLSKRELEKELKTRNPEQIPQERVRAITGELDTVKIVLTQEMQDNLKFLKDFYSKKTQKESLLLRNN